VPDKPTTAAGYRSEHVELVKATCLYVATKLGDLSDEVVVIGGLVPSLLIAQDALPAGAEPHVGTMDLDIGLTLAVLDDGRYRTLTERLRRAGFTADVNEQGNPTRQRWKIESEEKVTVDFLIQPSLPDDVGGKLRDIEPDFAAVIAPGLHLAFQDRTKITLSGQTIKGENATRDTWVCGPGAYVVLKALAFNLRGENKDAYDLFYVLRNYGESVSSIVTHLGPLRADPATIEAVEVLRRDFTSHDGLGPMRVAAFIAGVSDEASLIDLLEATGDESTRSQMRSRGRNLTKGVTSTRLRTRRSGTFHFFEHIADARAVRAALLDQRPLGPIPQRTTQHHHRTEKHLPPKKTKRTAASFAAGQLHSKSSSGTRIAAFFPSGLLAGVDGIEPSEGLRHKTRSHGPSTQSRPPRPGCAKTHTVWNLPVGFGTRGVLLRFVVVAKKETPRGTFCKLPEV
jgi:hypothetical protein